MSLAISTSQISLLFYLLLPQRFNVEMLDTFSETLDEHNPWFCPKCGRNQCATKTLTVHRYPKFLIVYLKR